MATPSDWRLDDIERKANAAAPAYTVDALRGDVVRLEHTVRELSAAFDGLRATVTAMQEKRE